MKKVTITKNGLITNEATFETQELADSWLAQQVAQGNFGKAAHSYEQEVTPAVLDADGKVTTPAVTQTVDVPSEYQITQEDITASVAAQRQTEQLIANGKKAREDCLKVLDLVGGFNLVPGRSAQTDQMVSSFAVALDHLQNGRPGKAKYAIQQIAVDGTVVTQQMKDLVLSLLSDWQPIQ